MSEGISSQASEHRLMLWFARLLPAALQQFDTNGNDGDEHDQDEYQINVRADPLVPSKPVAEQGYAHTLQKGAYCVERDKGPVTHPGYASGDR
jgi:hypothetical protein